MPSHISLSEIPKLNHNKTNSQIEPKRDFSKIIMEGRKMMNPLISVKQKEERRKVRSHPRCQCEDNNLRQKLPHYGYKIPFCLDAKCDPDKCTIQKSKIFAPKVR